jgi:hypothetical protein
MTIEIRRFGGRWKARGGPPIEPYFVRLTAIEHAIDEACQRTRSSDGEMHFVEQDQAVIANILGAFPA